MRALYARRLVLDAGALRDAERHPRGRVWAMCEAEVDEGRRPLLPVTVLAQMWRGGAGQAGLARVVKTCELVTMDDTMARRVGALLGLSGTADVVDAMVVVVAMEAGAAVVTSDPGDLGKLAEAVGAPVPLIVL
ncbi:hypothetical protein [Allostreptomyces psammosilenae]|uniref:PIN domain-containing protein n=1 Tax=Allostreptomyces psammosilenae TaxID=1892865 RepID=A0A852ZN97_9ACTN|nr:hypothetical protein [Allostreptomyces psammosilenae]NYI03883.1 hypothetical protein [Allostreptomyces psammosilenae]